MANAVIVDYDRTLTDESLTISEEIKAFLDKLRLKMKVIISSGRAFGFFKENNLLNLGDVLVLENGSVIFCNKKIVFKNKDGSKIKEILEERKIPFTEGDVIISVKRDYDTLVRKAINGMSFDIEYNRDDLMILPKGINKKYGVIKALELLEVDGEIAAIGDAENDLCLFEIADTKGAVANAVEELKEKADYICKNPYGKGVIEFVDILK